MKFVSSRIFFRLTAVEQFTFHAIKTNDGERKDSKAPRQERGGEVQEMGAKA